MKYIKRAFKLSLRDQNAVLLLGPRKVGKSTYLKRTFSGALIIDLLQSDKRNELTLHPETLHQQVLNEKPNLVIIDEIQKAPELLDEVHWCLENTSTKFILCSSSARKLKKVSSGILGGRANRYEFFPLTTQEVGNADLSHILNHGLIPQHFLAKKPERLLRTYIIDYLEEEIRQEAIVKNLPAFSRFLETAALMNGELLNYENISREAGVSAITIKAYYEILVDTLIGFYLTPWEKSQTRRLISTRKFYLFDAGVLRALKEFRPIVLKTSEAGKSFELFLLHEIRAYHAYNDIFDSLFYWRTSTDLEVDLVIGRTPRLAMEFKCAEAIQHRDLSGLRAFAEEYPACQKVVVYCGKTPQTTQDGIQIIPWQNFCKLLWNHTFHKNKN